MSVIVQKFGGTSVADPERIHRCARRVVEAKQSLQHTYGVVVVVSAMGHTTDELVKLAHAMTDRPRQREMDMLLATGEQVTTALMTMAIHNLGEDAISFAGQHLGIVTDPVHTRAKIRSIDVGRIRKELEAGRIVVAAGFQGVTVDGHITTLGRGGSDTTAVALAAALGQSYGETVTCEIYTDVDGVYTADPRKVPNARKLDLISYEEMLELASLGAGVMHNRAVMCGRNYGVPIHVRHSQLPDTGTLIVEESPEMERVAVVGCALTPDLGRISLRKMPNRPGIQHEIFRHVSEAHVLVDDIMQIEYGEHMDISFTVEYQDLADIKIAAQKFLDQLGSGTLGIEVGLAKVSVVGVGMRTHTGVATTMFQALGDAGINIANITTSEIKISCIIAKEDGERAIRLVHDAFELDKSIEQRDIPAVSEPRATVS
jgi:aspartate kinase